MIDRRIVSAGWVTPLQFCVLTSLMLLLGSACGGGSSEPADEASSAFESLPDDQPGSEPLPGVLQQLTAEKDLLSPVPTIEYTQTMANTGVQISYTQESLRELALPASIEAQWVFMQDCVEQSSVAPLVIVRQGLVEPFTAADDVVRNEQISDAQISSVPIASASTLHGAVIQVSVTDFDGSLGTPLFNLRSILGRHLWLSNNLPERDYPFTCARQQP